jgi:hypothetical protein
MSLDKFFDRRTTAVTGHAIERLPFRKRRISYSGSRLCSSRFRSIVGASLHQFRPQRTLHAHIWDNSIHQIFLCSQTTLPDRPGRPIEYLRETSWYRRMSIPSCIEDRSMRFLMARTILRFANYLERCQIPRRNRTMDFQFHLAKYRNASKYRRTVRSIPYISDIATCISVFRNERQGASGSSG